MLMFSRNPGTREKPRDACNDTCTRYSGYYNNNNAERGVEQSPAPPGNSIFQRSHGDKRDSRASTKKSRPHSWHSTIQRGLARARSRSSGREKERDKAKRASSALNTGQYYHSVRSGKMSEYTNVSNHIWKSRCLLARLVKCCDVFRVVT